MALFRRDAVEHQKHKLQGEVLIPQSLKMDLIVFLITFSVIAVLLFLVFANYARKETVSGYLVPESGLTQIIARNSGIVETVLVEEGDQVKQGQPILSISSSLYLADGKSVKQSLITVLDEQISETKNKLILQNQQLTTELKSLNNRLQGLEDERISLNRQYKLQLARLSLVEEQYLNNVKLSENGTISKVTFFKQRELYLAQQQEKEYQLQRIKVNQRDISQIQIEIEKHPVSAENQLSTLRLQLLNLNLQRSRQEAQIGYTLKSPIDGRVSTLLVKQGQNAEESMLLASVLPENSVLEAQLFVPSRSIGFVKAEQDVKLLFDAFPYQSFGVQRGTVKKVSRSVIMQNHSLISLPFNEPVYKVTVGIDHQSINAYGQEHLLKTGMLVKSDIILGKRTLFEWLMEPVLSIKGRM